jgi:hypothetical protein
MTAVRPTHKDKRVPDFDRLALGTSLPSEHPTKLAGHPAIDELDG